MAKSPHRDEDCLSGVSRLRIMYNVKLILPLPRFHLILSARADYIVDAKRDVGPIVCVWKVTTGVKDWRRQVGGSGSGVTLQSVPWAYRTFHDFLELELAMKLPRHHKIAFVGKRHVINPPNGR